MFGWLCIAFGVALGVAIAPVFSVELFVLSLASTTGIPWLLIGGVVAAGQIAGKTVYYLGARGSIRLPQPLHRRLHRQREPSVWRDRWRARGERVHRWIDGLRTRCHRHPSWMVGTYGFSSVIGLPPLMATTVLAGIVRMRLGVFLVTGLLGRFIRFSALAGAPALFAAWLPL